MNNKKKKNGRMLKLVQPNILQFICSQDLQLIGRWCIKRLHLLVFLDLWNTLFLALTAICLDKLVVW